MELDPTTSAAPVWGQKTAPAGAGWIPSILHFIWLGDDAGRPDRYLATWAQHHPDWTINVWRSDDLAASQWKNGARMRELAATDARRAAALLRWEILLAQGGLVFDIDSVCLRSLDDSLLRCEAFACWESELAEPDQVSASFVGSVPNNTFIAKIVDAIGTDPELDRKSERDAVGSGRLTETWRSERYEGLTVYPSHYFNPKHPSGLNYQGGGRVYATHARLDAEPPLSQNLTEPSTGPDWAEAAMSEPQGLIASPRGPDGPVMNLNFFGHIDKSGLGRHCESVMVSLLKAVPPRMRINYLDCRTAPSIRQLITNGRHGPDTTLFFIRVPAKFVHQVPGRKILWVVFESDRLPQLWLEQIRAHDQVWTPSDWCRDVLLAHGLDAKKLRVVEEGVDQRVFQPEPISHAGFVFLSVGKYEARKSIEETIEAFVAEFPASRDPSVKLWLKADYPDQPARAALLRECVAPDPRIRIISDRLADPDMARLYNSADAFVFPSKAEGFGLPCIEAIACGLPMIATDYSGQSTILKNIQGLFAPVDYRLAPIDDIDYRTFYGRDYDGEDFGQWAQPSIQSLRHAMRTIYQEHAAWRERGLQASNIIRSRLSWDQIGTKVLRELTEPAYVPGN